MKKVFLLVIMILLLGGFATAKTPVTPITNNDLTDLKGEWTGERLGKMGILRTDLTIDNDMIPLRGAIILYFLRGNSKTFDFNNGRIEDGRLIIYREDIGLKLDLSLRKGDDQMKLEGNIMFEGYDVNVFFKKVKK
jgi:hypothetical protein